MARFASAFGIVGSVEVLGWSLSGHKSLGVIRPCCCPVFLCIAARVLDGAGWSWMEPTAFTLNVYPLVMDRGGCVDVLVAGWIVRVCVRV